MLKALSSSVLSLLMVVTLLWGGCVSCPQFFMFQVEAEKSCCNNDGQCERPTKTTPSKECKRMPLEPQGFASAHADLAVAGVVTTAVTDLSVLEACSAAPHPEAPVSEHSPPDLNVLHSTFIV